MTMESERWKLRKERKQFKTRLRCHVMPLQRENTNSSPWGKELAFVTTKFLIFDSLRVSWRYALEVDPSPLRVCLNLIIFLTWQNHAKSIKFSSFLIAQYCQEALLFFVPAVVEVEALQVHPSPHWIATFTHLNSHVVAKAKNWEPEVLCSAV